MKHIGIVNITTIGANICTEAITVEADRLGFSSAHPEYTVHAFPFEDYKRAINNSDWNTVAKKIVQSIEKLSKIGADFIIIPSNTPHFAIQQIQQMSPLPVFNMLEITVKECKRLNFRKVIVLGTKFTMQQGLYSQLLENNGIQAVIPEDMLINQIHRLIMDEIIPLKINPNSVNNIINSIKKIEADGVILGCTELPYVLNEKNMGRPVVDTTRLLAHKAVEFALQ